MNRYPNLNNSGLGLFDSELDLFKKSLEDYYFYIDSIKRIVAQVGNKELEDKVFSEMENNLHCVNKQIFELKEKVRITIKEIRSSVAVPDDLINEIAQCKSLITQLKIKLNVLKTVKSPELDEIRLFYESAKNWFNENNPIGFNKENKNVEHFQEFEKEVIHADKELENCLRRRKIAAEWSPYKI